MNMFVKIYWESISWFCVILSQNKYGVKIFISNLWEKTIKFYKAYDLIYNVYKIWLVSHVTAWKVSKYGPEMTLYLDTFHAVCESSNSMRDLLLPLKKL